MISAFVFDLDGVIVDTAKHHFTAWKMIANQLGVELNTEDNENLKGVSRRDSLTRILGNKIIPENLFNHYLHMKNDIYIELIDSLGVDDVLPGVKGFIDQAKSKGIKIAIGSSSANAKKILKKAELLDTFDVIVDGTDIKRSKPNPEVFLMASSKLNVDPVHCLVFEDAVSGIEAALNANMKCVGVGCQGALSAAHYTISGFEEINVDGITSIFL
jgi:beta-phosphoglucomutase